MCVGAQLSQLASSDLSQVAYGLYSFYDIIQQKCLQQQGQGIQIQTATTPLWQRTESSEAKLFSTHARPVKTAICCRAAISLLVAFVMMETRNKASLFRYFFFIVFWRECNYWVVVYLLLGGLIIS